MFLIYSLQVQLLSYEETDIFILLLNFLPEWHSAEPTVPLVDNVLQASELKLAYAHFNQLQIRSVQGSSQATVKHIAGYLYIFLWIN